jgi:hypothetical protein
LFVNFSTSNGSPAVRRGHWHQAKRSMCIDVKDAITCHQTRLHQNLSGTSTSVFSSAHGRIWAHVNDAARWQRSGSTHTRERDVKGAPLERSAGCGPYRQINRCVPTEIIMAPVLARAPFTEAATAALDFCIFCCIAIACPKVYSQPRRALYLTTGFSLECGRASMPAGLSVWPVHPSWCPNATVD